MTQEIEEIRTSAQDLTEAEKDQAARYLVATRDGVTREVDGLSEVQWNFKPAPDRWSLAEVMEHVAVIEGRILQILGQLGECAADAAERDVKQVDAFVLAEVPQRYPRVTAPARVAPTGRWAGQAALKEFLESRTRLFVMLSSAPHLRGHVFPHPIFGPWDGYQWILAAGGHCVRHIGQMREVKADPNFPAA